MTWEHIAIIILSAAVLFFGFMAWFNDREMKDYRKRWLTSQADIKKIVNATSDMLVDDAIQQAWEEMRQEVEGE